MFKRQPLTAVSSARPRCLVSVRVQSVRSRSDLNWANRQRGQEKGSNTMPTNPAPEHTPTPHNQPATGRSRQQRAAQVSEEVRMLNRGSTAATVSGGNNSVYPTTRSKDVDAEAVGGGSGRMGANDSTTRESAFAQSPGRPVRAGKSSRDSRSEHTSQGVVVNPNEGGEAVLKNNKQGGRGKQDVMDEAEAKDEDDGGNDELGPDPLGESTANELTMLE
ncbi:hypothetical protein E4T45_08313, partial [Aureobasidium sp. EXF-8846]